MCSSDLYLYGTVSQDKKEALFTYMQLTSVDGFTSVRAQLKGLDLARTYRVKVLTEISSNDFNHRANPGWWPEAVATGAELAEIGLEAPGLRPEQGFMLHLSAI